MGLDRNGVRLLLYARRLGADFSYFGMLGRQTLYCDARRLQLLFDEFGLSIDSAATSRMVDDNRRFCEPLLKEMGARDPESLDYSDYQQATHILDLNEPVPSLLHNRYSLLFDGGTLEHVFNFPTAINSCMQMIRPRGFYVSVNPANNFFGHGFYQFSPELYFTVFGKSSSFRLHRVLVCEDDADAKWYAITDPAEVRDRVTLCNAKPTFLMVVAQKIGQEPLEKENLQQSDYVNMWEKKQGKKKSPSQNNRFSCKNLVVRLLPSGMQQVLLRLVAPFRNSFRSRYFRYFNPATD